MNKVTTLLISLQSKHFQKRTQREPNRERVQKIRSRGRGHVSKPSHPLPLHVHPLPTSLQYFGLPLRSQVCLISAAGKGKETAATQANCQQTVHSALLNQKEIKVDIHNVLNYSEA